MKVRISTDKCQGHARCSAVAPNVYNLDDSGFSILAVDPIPDELLEEASEGAAACPERAISVED